MKPFMSIVLLGLFTLYFSACEIEYLEDADPYETSGDDSFSEAEEDVISSYKVDGDFIIKIAEGPARENWMKEQARHQQMWDQFVKMVAPDDRRWIDQFVIFDGRDELLGYVDPQSDKLDKWNFALAIDIAYPNGVFDGNGEFTYTLIHEYGHILSLNDTQIDAASSSCLTYELEEGCAMNQSFIQKFYLQFWASIASEWASARDEDDYYELYKKYQDRFLTEYAATNIAEDIAETFAVFITRENGPNGQTIAEDKIRFMYNEPELVRMRNYIKESGLQVPEAGSWKRVACHHKHHVSF